MRLQVRRPLPPMEALSVESIPEGEEWQYEPKWDGFRCLAFRDSETVELQSKSQQPLARYFPELVRALSELEAPRFVLDGEIAVSQGASFSFDALLQRIHPAASRIQRLSVETPAIYIAFDLLADEVGTSLLELPLSARRPLLESLAEEFSPKAEHPLIAGDVEFRASKGLALARLGHSGRRHRDATRSRLSLR